MKFQANIRLADLSKDRYESHNNQDTSFMIVFGGKNAETNVLFNDIHFLGIP